MPRFLWAGGTISNRKGKFDPGDEEHVKHSKIGKVWDLYEDYEGEKPRFSFSPKQILEHYLGLLENVPFVWRMLKDIGSIRACWFYLGLYLTVQFVLSLVPAVQLWYSGQLLKIVETAVEKRTVDKHLLFQVASGRIVSSIVELLLNHLSVLVSRPLNAQIKQYYTQHMFGVLARMDVPTYDDPMIQRQLEQAFPSSSRNSIVWRTVVSSTHVGTTAVRLISQLSVLFNVLKNQKDGPLFALLSFSQPLLRWGSDFNDELYTRVWAATTRNTDYIQLSGLRKSVGDPAHRKEIVAGDMWEYMQNEYKRCITILGEDAVEFWDAYRLSRQRHFPSILTIIRQSINELPQIAFTLRAVQYPASIPVSLTSLSLITSTVNSFSNTLFRFFQETGSINDNFATVRKMFEMIDLPNRIPDGAVPYPENQQALQMGMSIEFRSVSFKYPESNSYALKNVSFKIGKGQLCVILGENGSGKSTILKLMARLYDPEEGQILVDGHDIKTLKLADLRRAMAILFQDYTHFPLSIRENIGLGDPGHSDDHERIAEAATLGGASKFIERLDEGYDTYLDRPVRDYYSGLPEGTTNIFGRAVNFGRVRGAGGMKTNEATSLSGGQMQRIALSRTFMRSLMSESSVGLLLFDEPSASLDPTAEHDLFERLRLLRGHKTMIFSSHRFGNLTRNADMILYIHDSAIVEEGSHNQLISAGGEYARIWNLQAQAFLG
ncbi:hypothetical protein GYMLUDRAFT_43735 [Collybiopsis luxurians FD-317 M1]|uniref:ABC transporter domain-containing protein n=1 Tax=Collybiopsis luxurians FD-317 M1 TaxID=944289 RepID=A0A0D0B9R9_9AGAR|nr:hypothetical protein GYMLUDRAFT_43735 [Collybiopsis luxurians FD-317 M1]